MPWPFYLCLFIALWQGFLLVFRAMYKNDIKVWHFLLCAVAITGCVYFGLEK